MRPLLNIALLVVCLVPSVAVAAKKSGKGKGAPAAAVEPVKIVSPGVVKASVENKKKKQTTAYVVDTGKPLKLELKGPGKLTINIHQLMPGGKGIKKPSYEVVVDRAKPKAVVPADQPAKAVKLVGRGPDKISTPKTWSEKLSAGAHVVQVSAPKAGPAAVVTLEFYPTGAKSPAPIIIVEEASKRDLMASAAALDDDDEPIQASPPPVPPPPTPVVAPPPVVPEPPVVAEPPPPVETVVAAPAAPEPVAETPEAQVKRRVAAGEIRDGLLETYDEIAVVKKDTREETQFYRVAQEKSFSFMVAGPGEVTVRLHRIIDPPAAAESENKSYTVVMLENDVVLQQLGGVTKQSNTWEVKAVGLGVTRYLSEPKEYKLKIGPQNSRLQFQIAEAPEGMAVRYSFAPEAAASLSLLAGGLDDEEDGDSGTATVGALKPTMVMEVDLSEKIIVQRKAGFLSLMAQGGTFVPMAGGNPGILAGLQLTANLPFANRMFLLSIQGLVQRHTLALSIGDIDGGAIDAAATIMAIPVLAKVTARLPLGESGLALFGHGGGGLCYVSASRNALDAKATASSTSWVTRAGAGVEMNIKIGWLGLEGAYLYGPSADLGQVLTNYTPTGPSVALQYRLGL
ncbi:MAG: hypothetical protein HY903_12930 [Deltaproteobacteria bacterium]|nr:hypothetical protein [Deltaproteobacteria bacterium]